MFPKLLTTTFSPAIPMPEPLPPIPENGKEGILIGAGYGAWAGSRWGIPGMVGGAIAGAAAGAAVGSWMEEDD